MFYDVLVHTYTTPEKRRKKAEVRKKETCFNIDLIIVGLDVILLINNRCFLVFFLLFLHKRQAMYRRIDKKILIFF